MQYGWGNCTPLKLTSVELCDDDWHPFISITFSLVWSIFFIIIICKIEGLLSNYGSTALYWTLAAFEFVNPIHSR
jgi:hypothetical protein